MICRRPGSPGSAEGVVDLPTIAVPYDPGQEFTYRTREDELPGGDFSEVFHTKSMDAGTGVVDIPIAPPYVSPPGSLIPPLEEGREAASRPGQAGAIYKPLPDIIVPGRTTPVVSPEQLRFTAFHPKEVAVDTWNTLLVYAHIEPASQAIYADADKFKHELGNAPRKVSAPGTQLILRETNITIVPECKGVSFNPKRITFKWLEDWHRASFRFSAKKELAGSAGNGKISIFAGPLLIGTLKMALLFEDQAHQAAYHLIVLDHQNPCHTRHLLSSRSNSPLSSIDHKTSERRHNRSPPPW